MPGSSVHIDRISLPRPAGTGATAIMSQVINGSQDIARPDLRLLRTGLRTFESGPPARFARKDPILLHGIASPYPEKGESFRKLPR